MKRIVTIIFVCILMLSISLAYTVNVDNTQVGISSSAEGGTTVQFGSTNEGTVSFTVNSGLLSSDILDTAQENIKEFTMPDSDVDITLLQNAKAFTIISRCDSNLTITPNGEKSVLTMHSQTYEITPASGYAIEALWIDGQKHEGSDSYTFEDVVANHTIYATSVPKGTVSFVSEYGGDFSSKEVVYGGTYGELPTPSEQEGYIFTGWHLESECITMITANSTVVKKGNHNLYAGWAPTEPVLFEYIGAPEEYVVPITGIYKLEVYGAGGGTSSGKGGVGGSAEGYRILNKGEKIYVVVGGSTTNTAGGYNGGGKGGSSSSSDDRGAGGGGATHMAYLTGTLSEIGIENITDILIVAGGGGGGSLADEEYANYTRKGGNGGGENGENGKGEHKGAGAGQSTGYAFGQGGKSGSGGGGGGGLYGGGYGWSGAAGGGGSGYIAGVGEFTYGKDENGNDKTYPPSWTVGGGAAAKTAGWASISLVEVIEGNEEVILPRQYIQTGVIDTYEVPKSGLYKLEAWGAGSGANKGCTPSKGGYSCGYKYLYEGETLYVVLGGAGSGSRYNGGGSGDDDDGKAGGGGATHIARQSGTLEEIGQTLSEISEEYYKDILLVVAGGGGGSSLRIGDWDDYSAYYHEKGGDGGGEIAGNGKGAAGDGATTAGYGYAFGKGQSSGGSGGGGGGLFGGFAGTDNGAGGGGCGYIGGVSSEVECNGKIYNSYMVTGGGSAGKSNGKVIITLIEESAAINSLKIDGETLREGGMLIGYGELNEYL